MKHLTKYSSLFLMLAAAVACQHEGPDATVTREPVMFRSAIRQEMSVDTRGITGGETAFQSTASKISLFASATWTGHNPELVKIGVKGTPSAVKGAEGAYWNEVTAPLYWDDFGAGNTASKVATEGLTIYGVAVDGGSAPSDITFDNLTAYSCSVPTSQASGAAASDLLISNNIKGDDAYLYNKTTNATDPAELVFKHAFSKIDVNFKKGDGFTDEDSFTASSVALPGYNISGTLDITTGAITGMTAGNITAMAMTTAESGFNLSYEAIVLPGRNLSTDSGNALRFTIDGNTYSVSCATIYNSMSPEAKAAYGTMKSGVDYIIDITVNKTSVVLAAHIVDWETASAQAVVPVIAETSDRTDGVSGNAFASNFKMWYSKTLASGYNSCTDLFANSPVAVTYTADGLSYTPLYWPNHTDGYHFRGAVALKSDDTFNNDVTVVTDATAGDYIALAAGNEDTANIAVGTHKNSVTGNNDSGALATGGNVILTFYHKMTHVTLKLETEDATSSAKVNLGTSATDMAAVKVLSCFTEGKVRIGSGAVETSGTASDYSMPAVSTTVSGEGFTQRASYMVPQTLTDNMKFEVKITNADGTTDTYTSVAIKDIKLAEGTAAAASVTSWEPGHRYIYTLKVKKSGVGVSAVMTDWKTLKGSVDVPFIQ